MKFSIFLLSLLMLTSAGLAQEIDTAIIATDMTAVDAATASAAAADEGAPVVAAEDGDVDDGAIAGLQALGIKKIVIVGGPVVVKAEAEARLKAAGLIVVRLWGTERTGTAVAVAKHFWPEGTTCAVLVDDTKSNEADGRRHLVASNLASRFGCTFIPVPEGTVPAEVLATLKELNVKKVWFVGRVFSSEAREKLGEFDVEEVTGSDDEVEDEIEDEVVNETRREGRKVKLVIVAVPDWRASVVSGAHPNHRSVVRHVTSADSVPELVSFIQNHSITDVKVVGIPGLAQQVADGLAAAGINATLVSGDKADEISRKLAEHAKAEWKIKVREHEDNDVRLRVKIKASLHGQLNDTINKLDAMEAELSALSDSAEKDQVRAAIDNARARIAEVRNLLASNDIDGGRRLLAEVRFKADEKRFEFRHRLNIDIRAEVEDEEEDVEEAEARLRERLANFEARLAETRQRCSDPAVVDRLVEKARSLRESIRQSREAGDFTAAAGSAEEAKHLVEIARHIGEACRQGSDASISQRIEIVKEIRAETSGTSGTSGSAETKTETSGTSETSAGTSGETLATSATVDITSAGFSPSVVRIAKGGTVTWTNKDTAGHQPASAVHPTHTVYPTTGGCIGSTFDACRDLAAGESFSFTFNEAGTWRYHDHTHSSLTGAVEVK